jgi:hypothetical protein
MAYSTVPGRREAAGRLGRSCSYRLRPELRTTERIGALLKLPGDILEPSNGKPCFGSICYPIGRGRVIPKCTNPLKNAIRPLGLDYPFVAGREATHAAGRLRRLRSAWV